MFTERVDIEVQLHMHFTEAHCMLHEKILRSGSHIRICLSFDKIDGEEPRNPETLHKVISGNSIHIHPSYNQGFAADNDIAMLSLSETVDLNVYTPVCLPYYLVQPNDTVRIANMLTK